MYVKLLKVTLLAVDTSVSHFLYGTIKTNKTSQKLGVDVSNINIDGSVGCNRGN